MDEALAEAVERLRRCVEEQADYAQVVGVLAKDIKEVLWWIDEQRSALRHMA